MHSKSCQDVFFCNSKFLRHTKQTLAGCSPRAQLTPHTQTSLAALWQRLAKHEEAVLLFAKEPHVPFTNNRAERDLRMDKVKQKVAGCFRSEAFAKAYCRISSYLATMANHGYNPLIAIQLALSGKTPLEGGE